MARQKKPVHRVQMTEGKRNIIHQLLEEYDIQSAEDIQDALKDLLGGTIKEMMEAEMDDHLGYEKSERSDNDDYRNGYKRKQVNSRYGSMEIEVPQDRKSTFEPQIVKKRQKDISDIDQKIISMYAKGMTTRQISETIEDIYGFETSESFISDVTDKILPQIEDWQNRPLDEVYPILYIDAIHYSVRDNGVIRKLAAYVILGINTEGKKEVLTISVGDNESAKYWLSVMNELKNRGVKDVLVICADGLTGIKEAIAAAFPKTEYQRCIVHQVRNTLKYVPDKDRKAFATDLKTIYHGYYADSSRMFCIGNVSPEHKKLVNVVKECVELGLEQVKPWGFMGDMAEAVQKHAEENGYSVVREIGGHGVGIEFHEDPWVGYIGQRGTGMMFAPGMMFTIEPMINEGTEEVFVDGDDDWSVYTKDGKASAQWEIQVLVTEDGHEVLSW